MKYNGRMFTPLVVIILIAGWHISYFLIDTTASHTFFIVDGFAKYDFIYTPLILPFFWWMGKKYDEARFYSERDPLTSLYNRRFVRAKFPGMLERASKNGEELNIFVVDINGFKIINDTYGHEVGDQIIQHVSAALLKNTKRSGLVARWGGDEFLVITSQPKDKSPNLLMEMIERTLKDSSQDVGKDISVSIGNATYPNNAKLPNELIRIADKRMYEHKLQAFDTV